MWNFGWSYFFFTFAYECPIISASLLKKIILLHWLALHLVKDQFTIFVWFYFSFFLFYWSTYLSLHQNHKYIVLFLSHSNIYEFYFFSCLIAMTRSSRTVLNKNESEMLNVFSLTIIDDVSWKDAKYLWSSGKCKSEIPPQISQNGYYQKDNIGRN